MNKYKRLAQNSMIFAIANFGSKVLTFLLVPYYTYVLTTTEYGLADTMVSTLSLILPLITFYIQDATMRFAMDDIWLHEEVLSVTSLLLGVGAGILAIVFPFVYRITAVSTYIPTLFLLLFADAVHVVIGQYLRGVGKIKQFAFSGILYTLLLCVLMPFFLSVQKGGVHGFLQAQMWAHIFIVLYYFGVIKTDLRKISFKINRELLRQMLRYSIPLIPNAVMWWIMNASDRYMLIAFMGSAAVGLYSVASKIPTVLNMVTGIFFQAFQISAIEEYQSSDQKRFYSQIYYYLACLLIICIVCSLAFLKPVLRILLAQDFQSSTQYVPFLMMAFLFSSLGAYYGTFYAVSKQTIGAMRSTVLGAVTNLIANFIFIPLWGINGAAVGTCLGMLAMFVYRGLDTKKYVHLCFNTRQMCYLYAVLLTQILLFYRESLLSSVMRIGLIFLALWCMRKDLAELFFKGKEMVKRKKEESL